MRPRLGISISSDAVRGLLVRSGRVAWHARISIEGEPAGAVLERLLSDVPSKFAGRGAVRVTLGVAHSHVKRLEGLPRTRHPRLLARVVRENADAFFPRLGVRTLVTDVDRRLDGSIWAAALDGALVDEVIGVLRRRRLTTDGVMPFAAAVAHVVRAGVWCVSDAGIELELSTLPSGAIGACRRGHSGSPAARNAAPPVSALRSLGSVAPEFIGAYGAAIAPARAPFTWRPARDPVRARALDVARGAAASLLFIAATGAALFARGIHAARITAAATDELSAIRDSQVAAARVDAELRRATTDLDRIRQFDAARGRLTLLLGALSEALPDSTALVSLRVDTLEGSLVALAPRAAAVLPPLFDLTGVIAPRIVGSVTREVQGGARVERASIRFRRVTAGQARRSSSPRTEVR